MEKINQVAEILFKKTSKESLKEPTLFCSIALGSIPIRTLPGATCLSLHLGRRREFLAHSFICRYHSWTHHNLTCTLPR